MEEELKDKVQAWVKDQWPYLDEEGVDEKINSFTNLELLDAIYWAQH